MNIYKIRLADGDTISYNSNMTLDELKQYITSNDFIELPRSGTVPYGNNGWRAVPKLASYQTKAIVYIDHDTVAEEVRDKNKAILDKEMPIINKIFEYKFNKKMQKWLYWNVCDDLKINTDEEKYKKIFYFYGTKRLQEILDKCKKYKCEVK